MVKSLLPDNNKLAEVHMTVGQIWYQCFVAPSLASDKTIFISELLIFFLYFHENICCGYSLEAPCQGASNEYPQHMFSKRNKKNIMWIPTLIRSYEAVSYCWPICSVQYSP